MSKYNTEAIRAMALVGHGASGKTSLAEALLFAAGAITAKGSVERGSTVCDFDAQEKEAGHSLNSAIVNFAHEGTHIHLIDTPGYPDFSGQAIAALAGADTALIVVNAQNGVELMTERMMRHAAERKLCRMIVINKIDADNLDLPGLVADIRERFGKQCMLLDLPAHGAADVVEVLEHDAGDADFASVAAAHRALIDQIVEEDEDLLAQYLEDGADPSPAALHAPFEKALREGHLIPILFVSARTGAGIKELLHVLASLAPNPAEGNPPPFYKGELGGAIAAFQAEPDAGKHVLAHVFKVVADPYLGKIGVFRVHQGTMKKDMQLFVGDGKRPFKVGHLYQLQGREPLEVDELLPGDIGAVAKVDEIEFDCVLHDSHDEDHIHLVPLEFPKPMAGLAVETRKKGDEQRLFDILGKLAVEDPTFIVERHPTSNETVIRGLGEIHLKAKLEKMAAQYKLEVDTKPPTIPYRETITGSAEGIHRHTKQSGGAGQFGEVALRVEPLPRGAGIELGDEVKGGTIPTNFMPAVEKGVRQALAEGALAGFPLQDLRVVVTDGKHHAVDSNEVSFVTAGRHALLEAVLGARPILLEPLLDVQVKVADALFGEVSAELAGRRGRLTATDSPAPGWTLISARVPMAALEGFESRLKAICAGESEFVLEAGGHEPAPQDVQAELARVFSNGNGNH